MILAKIPSGGRDISVAVLHLKAGPAKDFGFIRGQQIRETIQTQEFLKYDDAIMIGDFNMRDVDDEKSEALESNGYEDIWLKLRPNEPGYTYDINRNTLARAISQRIQLHEKRDGSSNRFDRVMLKSSIWKPKSIDLFGTEPVSTLENGEPLFASDHFGLLTTIAKTPN
jgi:endonuclease/exonuclease/phosphatase family metal-dependent hydrolase